MSTETGDYNRRYQWLKRAAGTQDSFGQKPGFRRWLTAAPDYPSQGYIWGTEEDQAANRETQKESERNVVSATIRLRNFPPVGPGDQLINGLGFVWTIDTVRRGDNEMICEVSH